MKVDQNTGLKVVIYGGNGFVGTHVAKELAKRDIETVCLSRSGYKPVHLNREPWSEKVRWCKGDASDPDKTLLQTASTLVCLVGSPPLPTFSQQRFDEQYFMNGITNGNAIDAAGEVGVKRLVLLSAQIPSLMRSEKFAYYTGKRYAQERARAFANLSEAHSAVIIEPGVIAGRRQLENGKAIPLDKLMLPGVTLIPSQFVRVERLAKRIADEALVRYTYNAAHPSVQVIQNKDI